MVDGIVSRRKTISQVGAMSHELGCQGSVSLAVTLLQLQKVREEICLLLGWWDHPGHGVGGFSTGYGAGTAATANTKSASRAVMRTLFLM